MAEPYVYRGGHYRDDAPLAQWLAGQKPEPVLEPDLPIIDPHHHLWDNKRGRYLLSNVLADINSSGHKIVKTMFEECEAYDRADGPEEMRPVGEVEFVRGIRAMSRSGQYGPVQIAAGIVGYADMKLGARVRPVLEAEIEAGAGLVRGIRNCSQWDEHPEINSSIPAHIKPGWLLEPNYRAGVAQVGALGLVYDVWLYFPQLPELAAMARALPNVKIVLNHCGGPICVGPYYGHREKYMAIWTKNIQELATCPNVYVKLGGLGMLHFGFNFHLRDVPPTSAELADAWRLYMETCIKAFGVKRGMFESNFPPDKQQCSYLTLWNAFKRITAGYSADEKAALYGGTASEAYGLK